MPSPFPCNPVIRECSWNKTQIEKKKTFSLDSIGATISESSSQTVCLDIIIKTSNWHKLRQYFSLYCQLWKYFFSVEKSPSRTSSQNLEYVQREYQWWSFAVVKPLLLRVTLVLRVCEIAWVAWVVLMRGFVIGVSQTLADVVWVAWIHKVLGRVKNNCRG